MPTTSTPPPQTAAPIHSSPYGDSSNPVQNRGSSNMAIPTGASDRPDDQGTSPPLKETNETMLEDATEVPPEAPHPEPPPKIPQEREDGSEGRSEDEEGEDAQEGSSERTGSEAGGDQNDNIEVVNLTDDEEDDEDANNDGDGLRTNE